MFLVDQEYQGVLLGDQPVANGNLGAQAPTVDASDYAIQSTFNSSRGQLSALLQETPGLVNGFLHLQKQPAFRWKMEDGYRQKIKAILEAVVEKRQELLAESETIASEEFLDNKRFLNKVFQTEQAADRLLSGVFSEAVPPRDAIYYLRAMGKRFERGVLTSDYFREAADLSDAQFKRSLDWLQDFCVWHVNSSVFGERDTEKGKEALEGIYASLSVKQFLHLKVLMGLANEGDSIEDYLIRTKNDKFNTGSLVEAVRNVSN